MKGSFKTCLFLFFLSTVRTIVIPNKGESKPRQRMLKHGVLINKKIESDPSHHHHHHMARKEIRPVKRMLKEHRPHHHHHNEKVHHHHHHRRNRKLHEDDEGIENMYEFEEDGEHLDEDQLDHYGYSTEDEEHPEGEGEEGINFEEESLDSNANPYGEDPVENSDEDDGYYDLKNQKEEEEEGETDFSGHLSDALGKIAGFGDDFESHIISFDEDSEKQHMINFRVISQDLKIFEEEYEQCLLEIPDDEYCQDRIDACLGENMFKVHLDVKYETMKIVSNAEHKIRIFFIRHCYTKTDGDLKFSEGCDLMESDILDLIWNGFNFIELTELNRRKYVDSYATIPIEVFTDIINGLKPISEKFFELFDEIFAHKQVLLLRLKTVIDDRTKIIVAEAKRNPGTIEPKIITHNIEIEEEVEDPNEEVPLDLPSQQIGGQDPCKFDLESEECFRKKKRTERALNNMKNKHRILNHGETYKGLHSDNRSNFGQTRRKVISKTVKSSGINGKEFMRNWMH